ncbi:MAG: hypothetical protein Q7K16_01535 [Candidatus Azambacteria bacterium]|nr:hypothetical protein [Candidatus Azambacteria bacterium]
MKEKFLKIYANLPLSVRDEIICVLPDKGTVSWNAAYLEIKNDGKFAKEILKKLEETKLL